MDRFALMVERENFANGCSCGNCKDARALAVKIIRRQHAAVVRMVNTEVLKAKKFDMRQPWHKGYITCAMNVRDALTQYKKGKP